MQASTVFVAVLFAVTSFPFLGQGSPQDNSSGAAGSQQQQSAPATRPNTAIPDSQAAAPPMSAPDLKPVSAQLVGALDTKTAKAGDSVVVQTQASLKTADGTDMPKGTKLVGHVVGAQASTAGDTSQVAVKFDHAELAGGKNVPIQSQIQSVGSGDIAANSAAAPGPVSDHSAATTPNAASPATGSAGTGQSQMSSGNQANAPANQAAGGESGVAPGTVVATTGQIDIRTTSIPGVLVANNQPGHQDPRMAQASTVLLGAHKDVQLGGGTPLVMGVATSSAAPEMK